MKIAGVPIHQIDRSVEKPKPKQDPKNIIFDEIPLDMILNPKKYRSVKSESNKEYMKKYNNNEI